MKTANALLLILAASATATFAAAPTWDSSGDSLLNGVYYFRQVIYPADASGNASALYAYYGNITFSGTGAYTISNATFLSYTNQGFQSASGPATGTYSVSASGYGFLSSPVLSASAGQAPINIVFLVSNHILIGSETESGDNDLFIAAPVSSSLSNASFSGAYTISAFVPGVQAATAVDGTYQLNPNGAGSLGNVSISGFSGSGNTVTQSASGVKYAFSNGANIITFPTNTNANFYSGQEFMYLSPDSNFVFGGSPNGFDMFVGVRNASGSTSISGLYYEAGIEESVANGIDSFYGAFNASAGQVLGHERLLYSASSAFGLSYNTSYPASFSGTYQDPGETTQYTVGQGGARISYGLSGYLGIGVALPFSPPAPSGSVYIDPTGIVNTASSAPYTAGISPGDFLTFYNGVNLASGTVVASVVPYPTTLDNVQVLIDGLAAPIYYVSSTQVSVIVPYEVNTFPIATIQIVNNNVKSNIVTTYVNQTTPGAFTSNPVGGIGIAAMLDFPAAGGYYIVSASQPANPGDTIAAFVTGLGTPFPSNQDGAAGPSSGDILVQTINVDVGGTDVGVLGYAGLAPGIAGLYQINFTVPTTASAGNQRLGITGPDSYSNESIIPISSGATSAVRTPADTALAAHRRMSPRLNSPDSK